MSDLDEFGIPEEEWSLLTNALAEPVEQLIVVESKDPEQLREIERRLPELVGNRRLLRQTVDFNAMREPENVWETARSLTQPVNINVVELSRQEISPTPLFQRGGSCQYPEHGKVNVIAGSEPNAVDTLLPTNGGRLGGGDQMAAKPLI